MANNRIQIKRSTANATVTGLNPGELAFTQAGDILYIGNPSDSATKRIGGLQVPGTLTANQALVANATSGIDKVITANLAANSVWANGSAGVAGDVLTSNGTATYWRAPSAGVAGTDTQVQFNDAGTLAGDAGLTYAKLTDTLSVANTILVTSTVNAAILSVGASTIANSTGVYTGTVNAASHTVGTSTIANSTGVYTGVVNGSSITIGTSTISNSTGVYTGIVNGSSITVGTSTISNSTGVWTSGTVNGATIQVGTSVVANTTRLVLGTGVGLSANASIGTAGQVLTSNATTVYWSTPTTGTVTSVASGNGLTGGPVTTTGTLSVLANNGIVANSTGVFAAAANGISVTAAGINVVGADGLISNATGIWVGAGNGISVSADAVAVNGGSTLTVNATGVHVNSSLSIADLSLSGNLIINGTLTTVNTTNLSVTDPLIKLANGNSTSDTLDIGLFGVYGNTTNTSYTGVFRDASDSGIYKFFTGLSPEPTTTVDTANVSFTIATVQAYVRSAGLTTNSTSANLIANSTYAVGIVANSLTLSTALIGTSGGTGKSTMTNNAILVGNSTNGFNELVLGTSGYVLQSNGTSLVYDFLDGGTF